MLPWSCPSHSPDGRISRDLPMTDSSAPSGTRIVMTFCVVLGITGGAAQYIVIVSPSIRTLLDLRADAFGWLLSSWLVLGVAGSLAGGWLADRGYLRITALASVVLIGLSYGFCALPPSYARYLIGIALTGLGNSALGTIGNVAVMRMHPLGARRALTWLLLSSAGAGMAAPPVWAMLISRLAGSSLGLQGAVQVLFLVSGMLCLLSLFFIAAHPLPETRPPSPSHGEGDRTPDPAGFRSVVGWPLVSICLFTTLHVGADNGIFLWLPDFAQRRFNPSPFPVAWILSGFSGAYLVGRFTLIHLPDRWRDLTLLGAAAGLGSILVFAAFRSESQYMLAALYIMAGLAMSADYPSILSHVGQVFPHATGRVMAIVGAVSSAASVLVPPLMGYIGMATGTMVAGMMLPALMLAALSASAFSWRAHLDRKAEAARV